MGKVLIMTDLEGASMVAEMMAVKDESSQGYKDAVKMLMNDVNVAVSALIDAGAEEVYVVDGHASGKNFVEGCLDPRATQVWMNELNDVIKQIDACVMIGTHAMASTPNAFFDHTQLWEEIRHYRYNGESMGEIMQLGIFAGAHNVPIVAVSGDEAACAEAKRFYDGLETAAVKKAITRDKAECYEKEQTDKAIYQAFKKGYEKRATIKPYKISVPLTIEVEYNDVKVWERDGEHPDVERVNGNTLKSVKQQVNKYCDVMLFDWY